jgi:peptidyl-prolyl cis-trans isomerase B (cyclophilin B)
MNRLSFLFALMCAFAAVVPVQAGEGNPVVVIETSEGTLEAELYQDKAPNTVKNFLAYVNEKFFDNTVFHRVISNFMIQGGGFNTDMKEKPTKDPIKNEADNGLRNEIGTLAMARTGDPHSASAQWFINVADNNFLNHTAKNQQGWGYAVFGKVTSGMDVVVKIKSKKTGTAVMEMQGQRIPAQDVPVEPVVIKSIRLK